MTKADKKQNSVLIFFNHYLKVLKQKEETQMTKNKASQLVRIEGNAVFPGSVGFL